MEAEALTRPHFMVQTIHSFYKYLLNTFCVLSTILGYNSEQGPCSHEIYLLEREETVNEQIIYFKAMLNSM